MISPDQKEDGDCGNRVNFPDREVLILKTTSVRIGCGIKPRGGNRGRIVVHVLCTLVLTDVRCVVLTGCKSTLIICERFTPQIHKINRKSGNKRNFPSCIKNLETRCVL